MRKRFQETREVNVFSKPPELSPESLMALTPVWLQVKMAKEKIEPGSEAFFALLEAENKRKLPQLSSADDLDVELN